MATVLAICSTGFQQQGETTLNTDRWLEPGVIDMVTSISYPCKIVQTTTRFIFNLRKMFFYFKLTLEKQKEDF